MMTGTALHLIHPLGFHLDAKSLKRCGLDYWHKVNVREYDNFAHFLASHPQARFFLAESGEADTPFYTDVAYRPNDFIIFGSETCGLPQDMLTQYASRIIKIPMVGEERSLNLSVSAGIVLYEALRQNGFPGLV